MLLQERLLEDMKTAMKAKEKEKLSVIRMARAAVKDKEINERKDLTDQEVIGVVAKLVKQSRDSIVEYEKAGKEETVEALNKEIEVLSQYLPEQLTKEELAQIVEETISQVGAKSIKDMGKIMGTIMPKVKGKADGNLINELVREKLK